MKLFETPSIEIEKLSIVDVIATSGDTCDINCPNQDECNAFDCPFD